MGCVWFLCGCLSFFFVVDCLDVFVLFGFFFFSMSLVLWIFCLCFVEWVCILMSVRVLFYC